LIHTIGSALLRRNGGPIRPTGKVETENEAANDELIPVGQWSLDDPIAPDEGSVTAVLISDEILLPSPNERSVMAGSLLIRDHDIIFRGSADASFVLLKYEGDPQA
jgi:hypothetical protein